MEESAAHPKNQLLSPYTTCTCSIVKHHKLRRMYTLPVHTGHVDDTARRMVKPLFETLIENFGFSL